MLKSPQPWAFGVSTDSSSLGHILSNYYVATQNYSVDSAASSQLIKTVIIMQYHESLNCLFMSYHTTSLFSGNYQFQC